MVLMIKKPTRASNFGKYTLFPTDCSARKMLILIYIKFRTKKEVSTRISTEDKNRAAFIFG
jgi:hypothetical protein